MIVDRYDVSGQGAIVFGGGLGIGRAISLGVAELGADVAIVDIDRQRAAAVAGEVRDLGRKAAAVQADATDEQAVVSAYEQARSELGELHLLANVVGLASWAPALAMTHEQWDTDFARCLRYVWYTSRNLAERLQATGERGSIVNIASVDGLTGAPCHAAYGAAKAGLMSLTRTFAMEWAPRIRVNAIAPGTIKTPRASGSPEMEQHMAALVPLQRQGTPEDIGSVATFLLSGLADYVTGETIVVDGGIMGAWRFGVPPGQTG